MKRNRNTIIGILSLITLFTLSGCGLGTIQLQGIQPVKDENVIFSQVNRPKVSVTEVTDDILLTETDILDELESTLSGVYDMVNPSVVSIQVSKTAPTSGQTPGSPFAPQDPQGQPQTGAGSGFIWDTG